MAGRGRGGKTSSLTQEQLQTLGCVGKEIPQVQTAPPPTYPPLMSKPVTLETSAAQNYQILWKEDFLSHMRDSPYFLSTKVTAKASSIARYSDQWANAIEKSKIKAKAEFNWSLMPSELQAMNRKRRLADAIAQREAKKLKGANIEERLKMLEEKERTEGDVEKKAKDNSDSENDDDEEEVAVADEEMDDENDYGGNYFDNGEAYNEEDDNLDDGPVY